MKRIYIQPETEVIAAFYQGRLLEDTFSLKKSEAEGVETPQENDWGANEAKSLWDVEEEEK